MKLLHKSAPLPCPCSRIAWHCCNWKPSAQARYTLGCPFHQPRCTVCGVHAPRDKMPPCSDLCCGATCMLTQHLLLFWVGCQSQKPPAVAFDPKGSFSQVWTSETGPPRSCRATGLCCHAPTVAPNAQVKAASALLSRSLAGWAACGGCMLSHQLVRCQHWLGGAPVMAAEGWEQTMSTALPRSLRG